VRGAELRMQARLQYLTSPHRVHLGKVSYSKFVLLITANLVLWGALLGLIDWLSF
jgi:hypothetical protein